MSERTFEILDNSVKKHLWAAISKLTADPDEVAPYVAAHLEYMVKLEREGRLWASGPFLVPGVIVGGGLTILRAATEEEARRLMDDEPLIRLGLRSYDLHLWEVREGRITIEVDTSTGRFALP